MPKLAIDFCSHVQQSPIISERIEQYKVDNALSPYCTPKNSLMFHAKLDEQVIGFASLSIRKQQAQIHSLFIDPSKRNQGHGGKMILAIFDTLTKSKCERIFIEASETFQTFFRSLGFFPVKAIPSVGEQNENILLFEHPVPKFFIDTFRQRVSTDNSKLEQGLRNLKVFWLSEDTNHYTYSEKEQFSNYHRAMLPQAQKQIWLSCDTILNPILNDDVIRDSFLQLAKRNPRAEIRILLDDDKTGAGYFNHTLELAHKLTSFFEIRALPKNAKKSNEMITTVDFNSGIYRRDSTHYAGFAHFNNHLIGQRLRDKFENYWQAASPSLHLRRLSL